MHATVNREFVISEDNDSDLLLVSVSNTKVYGSKEIRGKEPLILLSFMLKAHLGNYLQTLHLNMK